MKSFLFNRAKEASTWRGLTLLITAGVTTLSPDQQEAIVTVGLGVTGLIGAFFPDSVKE